MKKVIVIGAGMGGLAAAARLAKAGFNVVIYEQAAFTGGKCRTEWIGDYGFDTGPSLLTIPAVYRDLFKKTGKRLELVLDLEPVDPAFQYNFSDGTTLLFPNLSLPKICEEIDRVLGKNAGNEWHALMQKAEAMWDVSRVPFVESKLESIPRLLKRKNFLKDLRIIAPLTSLRKLTNTYTKNIYLQKIIDRYATYAGSDPRRVPAVLLTIAFIESSFGAWHIKGGIGKLAEALTHRCVELGVEFQLNSQIDEILIEAGVANGVRIGSQIIKADYVIANADAELVYNTLIRREIKAAGSERRKLKKSTKSLAGFSLLLGLDNNGISGELPLLNHHNVYFPENYDLEFDQIFHDQIPVSDPTIYICAPRDSEMTRGSDKEAWFVLVNAPRHDPIGGWDWSNNPEEYAQMLIKKLDALGLRVSERLDVMEFRTPLDLQNSVAAPGGSIYGTSSNGSRSAFLRAKNVSPITSLYCVGGSAHPGGGLPLVGISGEIVAESIIALQKGEGISRNHH